MLQKRLFFDVGFLIILFFSPWWVVFFWGALGVIFFSNYYEFLIVGILFDLLYGGAHTSWMAVFGLMGLTASALLMLLFEWLKREWRSR